MAIIKLDGVKKKTKVTRDPLFLDEKYTGTEPIWDTARASNFTNEEYDHNFRKSMRYYSYYYSVKDLKKYLVEWLTAYSKKHNTFDKLTIDRYSKTSHDLTPLTACAIVKAHRQGMPLYDKQVQYLLTTVNKVLAIAVDEQPAEDIVKVPATYKPNIQDRINEKMSEIIGELEGQFDETVSGITKFKAYDFFAANNVPQAQLGKFEKIFIVRKAEIARAQSKEDEQLTEAYSHFNVADFKRVNAFIDDVLAAIDQYRGVKRATKKARVKRPQAKDKIVARLKYLKEEKTLKLVSINPVDVIGVQQLYVYNVKTRKLGMYQAEELGGMLSIKGSAIIGFSESKSVQKTLRKPEIQLGEFMKAGKVQLRKFLSEIKAIEIKLTGRINADTLLLKVQ